MEHRQDTNPNSGHEGTESDLSKKQSQSKIPDLLRQNSKCLSREHEQNRLSEAPDTVQQKDIRQCIDEYQEECNLHASNLAKVHDALKAALNQWEQCQEQINKHEAVFNECQQALDDYRQLRKDTKRYKEEFEKIDKNVNNSLKIIEEVEEKIGKVVKKLSKHRKDIQKERKSTIFLCKECIRPAWELVSNISKKIEIKKIERDEIKLEELKKLKKEKQNILLEDMRTPNEKMYTQKKKYWSSYQDIQSKLEEGWKRFMTCMMNT